MSEDPTNQFEALLAEAVHEPPLLIPGTPLAGGRFVIRALLGTGGMGAVYRATDTWRDRDLAVKVLSRLDEATTIYYLKREFRSLSDVQHPNLVAIHELHSDGGIWFFTMDLVAGTPLARVRWTMSTLRSGFSQIAEAIQAIHEHGKLHRDLKPSNVMITPTGRVVVLDFGLVSDQRPSGAGDALPGDGPVGTPRYMAPELAATRATPSSDWYALGTMLYEALYGAPPFAETGLAVLERKRHQPVSRPANAPGQLPDDLEALCLGLLERDPAKRSAYREVRAVLGAADGNTIAATAKGLTHDPFVGRDPELRALERALLDSGEGSCVVVAVSGSPGIGKTTLVKQFLDTAGRELGSVVLSGRCHRWEHVPFRACDSLVDDLSRYLRTLPTELTASLLPGAANALTRIFPVLDWLLSVRPEQHCALPRKPMEIRRLGLAALRELFANIAARGQLIVFVDDMHWSDFDGARLLASLVARDAVPDTAMLLVIAHRTREFCDAPGLTAFFDRVSSVPNLEVRDLPLRELSVSESRQLAVRLLDGSANGFEERIPREAGGNPLFIRQLVRYLLESGSETNLDFDRLLTRRVAALPLRERRTLAAICLTPRPVSLDLLSRISGQPDSEAATRALESAQLARFTQGAPDSVTAFHDRIREAVVSSMDAGEHTALHARAVAALETVEAPDLVALTLHYLGCGRERDAAASAVSAARAAVAALAFEQAAAMYRLALDLGPAEEPERIDLLVELAEALVLDRRSPEAGARFLEAAERVTNTVRRRALRFRAADHYLAGGWLVKGIRLLREIFGELDLDYDEICRSDLLDLRRQVAERGLVITPRSESEIPPDTLARLEALRIAGNGLAWIRPESVQFRFALALEALDAGEPVRFALGLRTVARFDAQLDPDDDEVHRVIQTLWDAHPESPTCPIRPALDPGIALVRGRPWEQYATARHGEGELLQRSTQDARALDVARLHQALGLWSPGDVHPLRLRCAAWLEDAEDRNDLFLGSWLHALLASPCLADDRPDTAREMIQKAMRLWAALEDDRNFMLHLVCTDILGACDAYDGDDSAFDRLDAATRGFAGSGLSRIPFVVCHYHCIRARTALACAQRERSASPRRAELLDLVEASVATAAHPRGPSGRELVLPHYRNLSSLLGAGLAAVRGDSAAALSRLDIGLAQLGEAGCYEIYSAHVQRARGALLGGAEGDMLVETAEAGLRRLGVLDPARHARAVLPGFP